MATEATPFEAYMGVRNGRIEPTDWVPPGSTWVPPDNWVMCLGSAVGVAYDFNLDDEIVLSQTADVTGMNLMYFRARLTPPASVPAGVKWVFTWGVGAAVHGQRELVPGRTRELTASVIDVSQLSGDQELRFTLKAVAA